MAYLPAKHSQKAETAIITTFSFRITLVINRGSVSVCVYCVFAVSVCAVEVT